MTAAVDVFDLIDPERYARGGYPHDTWTRLRAEAPVAYFAPEGYEPFWAITKHADVLEIAKQPLRFSSAKGITLLRAGVVIPPSEMVVMLDPPKHGPVRRVANGRFTPRAVREQRDDIERIAVEILDDAAPVGSSGELDFVDRIAAPFPLGVIAWVLGAPPGDWERLFRWTNEVIGKDDPEYRRPGETPGQTIKRARGEVHAYFRRLIEQRRTEPRDDLVSALIKGEIDGKPLSDEQLVSYCELLVEAGNETTRNAISGGLLAFSEHPDEWEKLRERPDLLPDAVEEILRWSSPISHFTRTATEDYELRDAKIRAGEQVALYFASANRDEDVFEDPFAFKVDRRPNPHLAFGFGEHFCMGAHVARVELETIFRHLLARFDSFEVAGTVERLSSITNGSIKHLPLSYGTTEKPHRRRHMSNATAAPIAHADRFFIGGEWVAPSTDATIDVIDSTTEELYYTVAEAAPADITRAVAAARHAFDDGPWPRLSHAQRAEYLRVLGAGLLERGEVLGQLWPRETGTLFKISQYAALADTFPFEEECAPTNGGAFGLLVREPVGVVGAIVPWNAPVALICHKIGPALLAGCTVVLKSSPEAPGEGNVFAEVAQKIGLPPGVLNVVTADREVSELLVRDPGVDKITFTGSTAAGRRIAAICGERIARCTLELGGKSAAVILDDMDLATAAKTIARAECAMSGQVCSSLTRIVVSKSRHDEMVAALADSFSAVRVGDPFDEQAQIGPVVSERQRDRIEGYIAKGIEEGAQLATGGGRPADLRGFYVQPTVFGNVDNTSTIGREEIFGPVLSVIPAADEQDAVRIANDTIYGLNASVFTNDADRAREVASQLRSGTVGHNAFRTDFGMAFGGFKQSGIGREGGKEGLLPFLETKTVILEGTPTAYGGGNAS